MRGRRQEITRAFVWRLTGQIVQALNLSADDGSRYSGGLGAGPPSFLANYMAERHGMIIEFPRGKHIGHRVCDLAEEEHFYRCPACGGSVDCRDLGQVFDHEGPLPHPAEEWRQQDLVAR